MEQTVYLHLAHEVVSERGSAGEAHHYKPPFLL